MMIPWFADIWDWISEQGTFLVDRFAEWLANLVLQTDVTCKGSQRSIYLLFNFLLVIGAIILVESDLEFVLRLTLMRDSSDINVSNLWASTKSEFINSVVGYVAAAIRVAVQLAISSMQLSPLMYAPVSSTDLCDEHADGWLRGWNPDTKVSLVSFGLAWGFFFPHACHSLLHTFVWGASGEEHQEEFDEGEDVLVQKEQKPECPFRERAEIIEINKKAKPFNYTVEFVNEKSGQLQGTSISS